MSVLKFLTDMGKAAYPGIVAKEKVPKILPASRLF